MLRNPLAGGAPLKSAFARAAFLAAALNVAAAAAQAQTFAEFEARLAEHPSVQALLQEAAARQELSSAERALPDPVVSFAVSDIPVRNPGFGSDPDSNKAIGVAQEIPNPGVRGARSARERGEAQAVAVQAAYRIAQLRAEFISSLAEKRRIKEQIGAAQSQLRLYGELEAIIRGELEAGRPIYYRRSQIDVERADVERSLVELHSSLAQIDANLVELVSEAPDLAPPEVQIAPWNGEALLLHAARMADAGVDIAKAGVREGKAAFGPNFGLGLAYMQREDGIDASGAPFSGDDWFAAGVSVTVPLWAANSQAPRLRAARARQAGAELAYQAVARDVRERLTSLRAAHAASERNIVLLEQKGAALTDFIAAARRNYEAGNGDYVQVLDAEIARLTLLSRRSAERANAITLAARFNSELVTP